jgi:hypothetical protein
VAIAVRGRLDDLLKERGLHVDDLKRELAERYGLHPENAVLESVAWPGPPQVINVAVAAAVAMVLGVEMGELFAVETAPEQTLSPEEERYLNDEKVQRIWDLLDMQLARDLTASEQRELEVLTEQRMAEHDAWIDRFAGDPQGLRAFIRRTSRPRRPAAS